MAVLWVALGSALGGAARFLVGSALQRVAGAGFPVATLVINVTGSFALGVLARLAADGGGVGPSARLFLAVGVCGGYTTFSTFSLEAVELLQRGRLGSAGAYVAGSVLLSLVAVAAGSAAARGGAP